MPEFTEKDEPKPSKPIKQKVTELDFQEENNEFLFKIEEHLSSIRGMLKFFVVLTILAIIIQACSLLL